MSSRKQQQSQPQTMQDQPQPSSLPPNLAGDGAASAELSAALGSIAQEAANDGTAAPGEGQGAQPQPQISREMYLGAAAGLIAGGLKFVTMKTGVSYAPDTIKEGAEALAPLLEKYQAVPAWMLPYMDEFKFGMWAAGVAFKTWMLVNAEQQKQAAEAAKNKSATAAPAAA